MKKLICCLEEPSAKEMLNGILPKLGIAKENYQCIVFEGKQDLEKRLGRILKAWQEKDCIFLVLRDKDSGDCYKIKQNLRKICSCTNQQCLVRIACHELESFYLGDLAAVEQGLNLKEIKQQQTKKKFRYPDNLANPANELANLTKGQYQKVLGSRAIAPYLDLQANKSHSCNVLVGGIIGAMELA